MSSRLVERALLIFGLTCLGWYGLAAADAAQRQQEARVALERAIAAAEPAVSENSATAANATVGSNLIGLLEIPRLGVSTPVVEGDDDDALRGTAGHLPDTPRPWEKGNSAIAAHRDGLFRPLRNIRVGDELRMHTPYGELLYEVKDTHIVRPSDLSVLQAKSERMLTLITCYPFYYVGSAPKRFIVHAELVTPPASSGLSGVSAPAPASQRQ
jgi:sortase A